MDQTEEHWRMFTFFLADWFIVMFRLDMYKHSTRGYCAFEATPNR
jgi:hypothetical protein